MSGEFPKFRDDIIVSEELQGGARYFLLKDPVSKRFFRLGETEYTLARFLDGDTSLADAAERFEERFGVELPVEKLEAFVTRLRGLGLVFVGDDDPLASRPPERRGAGKFLYIKFKAVNPDRLFTALAPRIRFFFTRWFVVLTIGLAAVAIAVLLADVEAYADQAGRLVNARSVPALLMAIALVTLLHESAHGLTCAFYGGRVTEMGFLLLYFLPAFYCNVSDAWLLTDRGKRIWVSLAGMFIQVFIWAAAALSWRVIDQETWLSGFLVFVMGVSGLTTIFNLNPLIKLDGYYMLSDWLGIPNLRKKAFGYLGGRIRALAHPCGAPPERATARERRIYLWYGAAAGIYSAAILVFVFGRAAAWVLPRYHGAGLLALAGGLILLFTGGVEGAIMRIRDIFTDRKGHRMKRRRLAAVFVLGTVVLLALVFARWELKISSRFVLLPGARATIRAEIDGVIAETLVDEGDTVSAGKLLVRIDDREYRSELQKTEAESEKWRASLDLLRAGPLDIEVVRQEKLVDKARSAAEFAQLEFDRMRELYERNLASRNEYEKAEQQLVLAKKDVEHAESDLRVLTSGARPEKIREAEAEVARLAAALDYLSLQIARAEITSPIAGVVSTHRLRDRLGEHLEVGDEICEIVSSSAMLLEMHVSEKDIADVRKGMKISLKARSSPGRTFTGRVVSVPPVAVDRDERTVLVVTGEVRDAERILKPGMTGTAKIHCGRRRIIDLVTRKLVRFIRVEFWWW